MFESLILEKRLVVFLAFVSNPDLKNWACSVGLYSSDFCCDGRFVVQFLGLRLHIKFSTFLFEPRKLSVSSSVRYGRHEFLIFLTRSAGHVALEEEM